MDKITTNTTPMIHIGTQTFEIEIANTPQKRATGLMHRAVLDDNKGMLFIFDSPYKHSFWMKNTLIPLDIIWINSDLKVIDYTTMTPCKDDICPSYIPKSDALYALEVNAGAFQGDINSSVEINNYTF